MAETIGFRKCWFVSADHKPHRHNGPEHKALYAKIRAAGFRRRDFPTEEAAKTYAARIEAKTGVKVVISQGGYLSF